MQSGGEASPWLHYTHQNTLLLCLTCLAHLHLCRDGWMLKSSLEGAKGDKFNYAAVMC